MNTQTRTRIIDRDEEEEKEGQKEGMIVCVSAYMRMYVCLLAFVCMKSPTI
jgi:hypothetical protein